MDHESTDGSSEVCDRFAKLLPTRRVRVPFETYLLFGDVFHNLSSDLATRKYMFRIDTDEVLHDVGHLLDGVVKADSAGLPVAWVNRYNLVTPWIPPVVEVKSRIQLQATVRLVSSVHEQEKVADFAARTITSPGKTPPVANIWHLNHMKSQANSAERTAVYEMLRAKTLVNPSPYARVDHPHALDNRATAAYPRFKAFCEQHGYDFDYLSTQWDPADLERAVLKRGVDPSKFDMDAVFSLHKRYIGPWKVV
jgi:hypothetical protein